MLLSFSTCPKYDDSIVQNVILSNNTMHFSYIRESWLAESTFFYFADASSVSPKYKFNISNNTIKNFIYGNTGYAVFDIF